MFRSTKLTWVLSLILGLSFGSQLGCGGEEYLEESDRESTATPTEALVASLAVGDFIQYLNPKDPKGTQIGGYPRLGGASILKASSGFRAIEHGSVVKVIQKLSTSKLKIQFMYHSTCGIAGLDYAELVPYPSTNFSKADSNVVKSPMWYGTPKPLLRWPADQALLRARYGWTSDDMPSEAQQEELGIILIRNTCVAADMNNPEPDCDHYFVELTDATMLFPLGSTEKWNCQNIRSSAENLNNTETMFRTDKRFKNGVEHNIIGCLPPGRGSILELTGKVSSDGKQCFYQVSYAVQSYQYENEMVCEAGTLNAGKRYDFGAIKVGPEKTWVALGYYNAALKTSQEARSFQGSMFTHNEFAYYIKPTVIEGQFPAPINTCDLMQPTVQFPNWPNP